MPWGDLTDPLPPCKVPQPVNASKMKHTPWLADSTVTLETIEMNRSEWGPAEVNADSVSGGWCAYRPACEE